MHDALRRPILIGVIAVALLAFAFTVILELQDATSAEWYIGLAFAFAVLFVIAFFTILASPAAPAARVTNTFVQSREHRAGIEQVLYVTRRGHVHSRTGAPGAHDARAFTIDNGSARSLDTIERAIDVRGWTRKRTPTDDELRAALSRWGTIQSTSQLKD